MLHLDMGKGKLGGNACERYEFPDEIDSGNQIVVPPSPLDLSGRRLSKLLFSEIGKAKLSKLLFSEIGKAKKCRYALFRLWVQPARDDNMPISVG